MTNELTDDELIEAVAIEVFGATKEKDDKDIPVWWNKYSKEWIDRVSGYKYLPLTNANHWMMVVEKTEAFELIYAFRLFHAYHPYFPDDKQWLAQFISAIDGNIIKPVINKSIGHAICLASLKAVRSLKP